MEKFSQPLVKPWPLVESRPIADHRIFKIRSDLKTSPRTGRQHDFFVLEAPNWVNVVALTRHGKLVMIEQFRHGTNTVELEIPGGVMDPGETDPVAAGLRELREETGYVGLHAELIGSVHANPAIFNNTCHTVLVRECSHEAEVELDQGEDLATRLVNPAEIPGLVRSGRIGHSLVVVALFHYDLWRTRGPLAPGN